MVILQPKTNKRRTLLRCIVIGSIVLSVVILSLAMWESFSGGGDRFFSVELPGFHEVELKTPGLYAGLYQHQGSTPIPVAELLKMEVRLLSKDTYEQIPVLMNTTGQTFQQLGVQGMALFNFVIQQPGAYTLSGVYPGEEGGPTISVLVLSQAVQDVKQTMIVGLVFFALFLAGGIWVLINLKNWAPKLS